MAGAARIITPDKVRELQITLYRKAKASPGYCFWSLYGELLRVYVLSAALDPQLANGGAAGVEGKELAAINATPEVRQQWLEATVGHPDGQRPDRANGGESDADAHSGGGFSSALLRLPAPTPGPAGYSSGLESRVRIRLVFPSLTASSHNFKELRLLSGSHARSGWVWYRTLALVEVARSFVGPIGTKAFG